MRSIYLILLGQFLSVLGSGMTRFGASVWVFEETGSTTAFTTLIFFAVVPLALGALFAGPIVDRFDRRVIMIAGNVTAGLSTLGIMLLFYTGVLAPWHLYTALSVNGFANAFIIPALEASVPLLVSRTQLERTSGLLQLIQGLDAIISPALAGVLVTSFGLGAIFGVDVITFSVGVMTLLAVVIPKPDKVETVNWSFIKQLRFGVTYLWQRKPFVTLISLLTSFMFFQGVIYALTGPLVLNLANARALGSAYAGFGTGALVGGALLSVWGGPERRMNGIIGGMVAAGLGALLAGLRPSVTLITVGFFVFGTGFVFLIGLNRVIYQVKAAPEVLGRIFSLRVVLGVSAQSIGILLAGPLVAGLLEPLMLKDGALSTSLGGLLGTGAGRGAALAYFGVGIIILALTVVAALPGIRRLEDYLPDYIAER